VQLLPCPTCGQSINSKRAVCPFCGSQIVSRGRAPKPPVAAPTPSTPTLPVASATNADPPPSAAESGTPVAPAAPTARPAWQAAPRSPAAAGVPAAWWKRPNIIIPAVLGCACAAILLALTLPGLFPSRLTPQQIYERHAGSVVEIRATLPGETDLYGLPSEPQAVLGTGFIVSKDGYLLTNAHVVSEGGEAVDTVAVTFRDGTQVQGAVVGADESTDVALIKVDPAQTPRLVPIPLGDSSRTPVGEQVVAIGNPLGLSLSLSSGVVSATDRELSSPNGATISGGIQTDAAINPGNSGGPLIDSSGHVIGINEQIDSHSGGNEGIGFAVPINTAARIMRQMQAGH